LAALADDVAQAIAEIARTADIALTVRAETAYVRGNAGMLRRALLNLVSNAVKFTPPGGSAEIVVVAEPDGQALIEVRDTGIGIAVEEINRVTEPFYQAHSGLNRHHEGAGLGLTIADRILRVHGGTLSLASRPTQGTVATVRLPLAKAMAELRRRAG
jgi:signal transduction histidine kinase